MRKTPSPLMLGMGWFPYEPGGLSRYYRGLFEALAELGAAPRAVVLGPAPRVPDGARAAGDAADPLLHRLRRYSEVAGAMGRSADLVDTHFALYSFLPLMTSALRRKPIVLHFHGPWADEGAQDGQGRGRVSVKRRLEAALYRRADRAIVLSAAAKRTLVERYRIDPWRIEIVRPGVDLYRFRPGLRLGARVRLHLPQKAWVAVAVRRLVPRMGIDVLLDAWARLPERETAILLVGGEGPERAALEAQAQRLGLADSVRFLGRIGEGELLDCYRAADACVVPSVALEGFGLVVLESLACGTPTIVSDVGGLPETVSDLDPGLVVPADDPDALAARIRSARDGTEPLPAADRCRTHAERFSWREAAVRHVALYRETVEPVEQPRRLRVVFLDHCARLSGAELALLRLVPALEDVDAHVVLAEEGPLVRRLLERGVSVEVLPLGKRARGTARRSVRGRALATRAGLETALHVLRLARRLRRLRPDVVHTNSLKAALYGGLAARLARVPVVWHVHDRVADDYLPAPAVRIVRLAARLLPHAVIANSRTTATTLPREDAHVVGNAILSPGPDRRPDGAGLRVGIVGRIAPWKGQDVALKAFARAFPGGSERLAVVGAPLFGQDEEDYAQRLRELSHRLGLDGRVEFRGFRDDVAAELAEVDVLVHASVLPEPFGQVVLEGMAAGVPVVAAGAGGPAEILEDRVTGLLYPPGDVAALADALHRLAEDDSLRQRLADAGRARARSYSPDAVAARVRAVYEEVLAP